MKQNEPHQSVMSEHKALEEHVYILEIKNEEKSCVETMNQFHLALMRNEKQVNRKIENREYKKLIEECDELNEEMQHLGNNCNAFLVKYRKMTNACNEVIDEMGND